MTYFYAWFDTAAAIADGAMIEDAETGLAVAAPGWTLASTNGWWIAEPVLSEPDPDTGEQTVLEPGVRSEPVVLVRPVPCAACSGQQFTAAAGGLA